MSYVTTRDGIVMIESPFMPTDAVKWRNTIGNTGTVKYLINTEPHEDHYTGDYFFSDPIITQEKALEVVRSLDIEHVLQTISSMDPGSNDLVKGYKIRLPSITFSNTLNLYLGNHSFRLIHLPGYSPSQTAIYVPEERVFSQETMLHTRFKGFCMMPIPSPGWNLSNG